MSAAGDRLRFLAPMVAGLVFTSAPAVADATKDECIAANGKAQQLRRDRKLSAARQQLHACADASCPAMVRDDCVKRLDELERVQPSIVFDVKNTGGIDVIDVRVSIDGQLLVDHLDGSPLMVDPGVHVFTFAVTGQPPVVDKLLIREGELGRHEPVVVGTAPASQAAPPGSQSAAVAPSNPADGGGGFSFTGGLGAQKIAGLALGGVGVVGLAVGTAFGLMTGSAWSSARGACGGNTSACTNVPNGQSFRSTAESDATISTIAFIAGGALSATGAVLFLTGGHKKHSTTGFVVGPGLGPRQAAVVFQGTFE